MNSYPRKRSRDADEQGATIREKRRPPRKVNPANPVKKLTTGLLETYKAINQVIASSAPLGSALLAPHTTSISGGHFPHLLVQRESQRRWPLFRWAVCRVRVVSAAVVCERLY